MSGSKRMGKVGTAATAAFNRAQQTAVRVKPYASTARANAGRGVHRARAMAAPQIERAGHALEDSVAPKVSAMLSSAAQRLEPAQAPRRRWRKLAGISLLAGAASAAAAVVRSRARPDRTALAETDTHSAAEPAGIHAGKAGTGADVDTDGQVRTS
jgi:hypothetical protein